MTTTTRPLTAADWARIERARRSELDRLDRAVDYTGRQVERAAYGTPAWTEARECHGNAVAAYRAMYLRWREAGRELAAR